MKLIVFDLDDTLLNSKGEVTDRNKLAINKCSQLGMKIGYITMRSARKMSTFLQGLPCDCLANYNGALIYADHKLIQEHVIAYSNGINFIKQVTQLAPGVGISAYFEPYCYKNHEIRSYITQELLHYSLESAPHHDFQRIRIFFNGYENIDFSQYTSNDMNYQKFQHAALITHTKVDKGEALKTIMNYFGIDKQDTISFGDHIIDIPMLLASGSGVAMGNAVSELKDIADEITLSNDEDGVASYIYSHLL